MIKYVKDNALIFFFIIYTLMKCYVLSNIKIILNNIKINC